MKNQELVFTLLRNIELYLNECADRGWALKLSDLYRICNEKFPDTWTDIEYKIEITRLLVECKEERK